MIVGVKTRFEGGKATRGRRDDRLEADYFFLAAGLRRGVSQYGLLQREQRRGFSAASDTH